MLNRSTIKEAFEAKPGCLSLEELEKAAESSSQEHPHLADCARCQAELAMLKQFEANTPLPNEGAAVAWISSELDRRLEQIKNPKLVTRKASEAAAPGWLARLFGTGSARWLVPVAAMAVIAAASAILLRSHQEPELAQLGNGPAIYRSQEVELISPSGEVPDAPKALLWKAFGGASEYKVTLMEVDHEPLWTGSTNYSSLTIPAATRVRMLPGKPVLWQVTALDSQGRTLAVSQLQRFSVARKSPAISGGASPR